MGLKGRRRGWVAVTALAAFLGLGGLLAGVGAAADGDLGLAAIQLGFSLGWLWIGLGAWRQSTTGTEAMSEN